MKMNQNSMRKIVVVAGMLFVSELSLLFADPTVTDVVAKQRYPWNGLVDITCKVTGISGTDQWKFSVAAVMPDTGEARKVSQFWVVRNGTNSTDRTVSVNGTYKLLWDAKADLGQVSYDNMVMRVTVTEGAGGGGSSGGLGGVQLWDNGPYWAECNVGASKPEEYGYYFWWGDTVGYTRSGGTWMLFSRLATSTRRAISWRRMTRRQRTSVPRGACRRMRSSPRSSTIAPPRGSPPTAYQGDW